LYIKFDKKLIVNIDEIFISQKESSSNSSLEDIKSILNKAPYILRFFESIDIETLKIKDNTFKIKFDNNYIYLDNKFLNLASKYSKVGDVMNLNIYSLYLKDIDFLLLGNIKIDYDNELLGFTGKYIYKNLVNGELSLSSDKDELSFYINSNEMKDIKFLKTYINLDKIAESWMYDNVKGKYFLEHLNGKIDLETMKPILKSIKGSARVEEASVKFNNNLESVKTSLINIEYQNDNLLIKLKEPTYKGISLDSSFVDIKDMTSLKYGHVDVTLKAKHILDKNVLEILEAYEINLPLKQLSGETKADVHLYIPYDASMKTFGVFVSKDAKFKINEFDFYSKEGRVDLINTKVYIRNTDFVHNNMIKANVNLEIDTKTLLSKGNANIDSFLIESKNQKIVELKDKKVDFEMEFKNNTKLKIDDLKTQIEFNKKSTDIKIDSLNKIYPYSNLLKDIDIKNGDLLINLYDLENIEFKTNLFGLDLPLKKDNEDVKNLSLHGLIIGNKVAINTYSNDLIIELENDKTKLFLKSYDIDYKKDKNSKSLNKELYLSLLDSNINIANDKFYAKEAKIDILKEAILFEGVFGKLDLPLLLEDKKVESLDIKGSYKNDIVDIESKDKKIVLKLENENQLSMKIDGYNLVYNSEKEDKSNIESFVLDAKNSNIIINDKHKVLADNYKIISNKNNTKFDLNYQNAKVNYIKDENKEITLSALNINDHFVNTFFNKDMVKNGTFDLTANGKDEYISGKMVFHNNRLKNLRVLNNIITIVNTTPALINPLLAIPAIFGMVTEDGFNLNGYNVNEGFVEFTYNFENSLLNLTRIHTVGNSVDFDGYATIDLKNSTIKSNIELVFMKDYSKIVGFIPGLSYIFLGEDKRISTSVNINGDLNNPKIETNIAKDSVSVPYNILKRIITSPFKLFE